MVDWAIQPALVPAHLTCSVPGDKSLSHRALFFAALANGITRISGFLRCSDCLHTVAALRQLGVCIEENAEGLTVYGLGVGPWPLPSPALITIDCGNSGTLMRLLCGLLAGQPGQFCLVGDASLEKRPMDRVVALLAPMGANIQTTDGHAPIRIEGVTALKPLQGTLFIPSAQLKTAALLAALRATGSSSLSGALNSRDHTERWLAYVGYPLTQNATKITIEGQFSWPARNFNVPGDFSHAAFLLVAAVLTPGAHLTIEYVGVNPKRIALLHALKSMGANIQVVDAGLEGPEPVAHLHVKGGALLRGIVVPPHWIPHMIDELPIFAVAAAAATGKTVITDAQELKFKESDRIHSIVSMLQALGVQATASEEGFTVVGGKGFCSGVVESFGDHRIAMSAAVAAQVGRVKVVVKDVACVATSFPQFKTCMAQLGLGLKEEIT